MASTLVSAENVIGVRDETVYEAGQTFMLNGLTIRAESAAAAYFLSRRHHIPDVQLIFEPGISMPAETYCQERVSQEEQEFERATGTVAVRGAIDGLAKGAPMIAINGRRFVYDHHTSDTSLDATCQQVFDAVTADEDALHAMLETGYTVDGIPIGVLAGEANDLDEDVGHAWENIEHYPIYEAIRRAAHDPMHLYHAEAVAMYTRHKNAQYVEGRMDASCGGAICELRQNHWETVKYITHIVEPLMRARVSGAINQSQPPYLRATNMQRAYTEFSRRYLMHIVNGDLSQQEPDTNFEATVTADNVWLITEKGPQWRYKAYSEGCEVYVVRRSSSDLGSEYVFGRRDIEVGLNMQLAVEKLNEAEGRKIWGSGPRAGGNLHCGLSKLSREQVASIVASCMHS